MRGRAQVDDQGGEADRRDRRRSETLGPGVVGGVDGDPVRPCRCITRDEPEHCPTRVRPDPRGGRWLPSLRALGAGDPDGVRRGPGPGAADAGGRAAGRQGGHRGASVRRPRRRDPRGCPGARRHRPGGRVRHERRQAFPLATQPERQAASPREADPRERYGVPRLDRARTRARPSAGPRRDGRHGDRRAATGTAFPSRAITAGRSSHHSHPPRSSRSTRRPCSGRGTTGTRCSTGSSRICGSLHERWRRAPPSPGRAAAPRASARWSHRSWHSSC